MPRWAGSCWYYLGFWDPQDDTEAWSEAQYDEWMRVDVYVGGAEHGVLHLLYARFWHKVLFDLGRVKHPEPFMKLVHQGMILGEVEYTLYRGPGGEIVDVRHVKITDDGLRHEGRDHALSTERIAE